MTQIVWDDYSSYKHSEQVSDLMRESLRPKAKFRQFATAQNGSNSNAELNRGDTFYWNVFDAPARKNYRLGERQRIGSSTISQRQNSLTVVEMGGAIEFSMKAELLSYQDWEKIIESGHAFSAASQFDAEAFLQFKATPIRAQATSGTSTTSVTVTTNSATATTNNVAFGTGHVKAIVDEMKERNIPPHMSDGRDCYYCITDVTNLRGIRNELEDVHKYTETGLTYIKFGEIGRYEDVVFVEQTMIPKGGANDSTTFDPYTNTADAWNNSKSSWAMFFGDDPVTEAVVLPEEIRAKDPEDYGRDKGTAWLYLGGFGITHPDTTNARVIMWDSAQ